MAKKTIDVVVGKSELAQGEQSQPGDAQATAASPPKAEVEGQAPYYGRMICPYGHVGYGNLDTSYYKKWTCWNCGVQFWA